MQKSTPKGVKLIVNNSWYITFGKAKRLPCGAMLVYQPYVGPIIIRQGHGGVRATYLRCFNSDEGPGLYKPLFILCVCPPRF